MTCRLIVLVFCLTLADGKIQTKIVGGRTTDIALVPYLVSLHFNGVHFCGGSIIQPSWILTAAHCLRKGTAGNYSIRAGSSIYHYGGVEVNVSRIIKHSYFDTDIRNNYDVALLELEHPLQTSKKIKFIPLSKTEPKRGDLLLVSGWGNIKEIGPYSHYVQSVTVPVISKSRCRQKYGYFSPISDNMICAGFTKGEKDSCRGDSGGPAVFNKKLVGIVSWGDGCARKNAPGVYTNVASIITWVDSQIS